MVVDVKPKDMLFELAVAEVLALEVFPKPTMTSATNGLAGSPRVLRLVPSDVYSAHDRVGIGT